VSPRSQFHVSTRSVDGLVDRLVSLTPSDSGVGIALLAGELGANISAVAELLARKMPTMKWLVSSTFGVFTEKGTSQEASIGLGMWLPGDTQLLGGEKADSEFGDLLADTLLGCPGTAALVLTSAPPTDDSWLAPLRARRKNQAVSLIGASIPEESGAYLVHGQTARAVAIGAVILGRSHTSGIVSSSACRLLGPLGRVTKVQGKGLLEIDEVPALSVLAQRTEHLEDKPLVFIALAAGERPLAPEGRNLSLQPIVGVDPARQSLLLSREIALNTRVGFAVADAQISRVDFAAHLGKLRRGRAGAAPSFGLYIQGAGRGSELYGSANADPRMIQKEFPGMPFIGVHSPYQWTAFGDNIVPQILSGVLGVFSQPS